MTITPPNAPSRRRAMIRGSLALGGLAAIRVSAAPQRPEASTTWDYETDVACVGSGAAACAAAVTASAAGAKVMVVEKMAMAGGTTNRSAGIAWIPNNRFLRERGLRDERRDCLHYMARYAYPAQYASEAPTLGLPASTFRLLEAFYENASPTIDHLQQVGAAHFREYTMWHVHKPAPDYADHLKEDRAPRGRALEPIDRAGTYIGGGGLLGQLTAWLNERHVPILLNHRVTRLIRDGQRVIGLEVQAGDRMLRIKARRGVIFGTGGYAHNTELIQRHQPGLLGSCAMPGATGDFISIAAQAGASMGSLSTAWRTQVVLEEALSNRAIGLGAFVLPGDSMVQVNRYGRRIVNEKTNYKHRTEAHFVFDPVAKNHPNQLQFMIFDERTRDGFGGAFPIPDHGQSSPFLVEGATLEELGTRLAGRLQSIKHQTGGVALAPDFVPALAKTLATYNGYAQRGVDPDFGRGDTAYDRDWHEVFSSMRKGTGHPANRLSNITMHPLAERGPYFAIILGAGALDTSGGPAINEHAQVLDAENQPIPGLYGAGNCVASPSGRAYFGAGHTIGMALTFGYIAGRHVTRTVAADVKVSEHVGCPCPFTPAATAKGQGTTTSSRPSVAGNSTDPASRIAGRRSFSRYRNLAPSSARSTRHPPSPATAAPAGTWSHRIPGKTPPSPTGVSRGR